MTLHLSYCQGDEPGPGTPERHRARRVGLHRPMYWRLLWSLPLPWDFYFLLLINDVQLSTNQGLQLNLWCEFVDRMS